MAPDQLDLMVSLPKLPMVPQLALDIKIRPQVLAHLQDMSGAAVDNSNSSSQDPMEPLQQQEGLMGQAGG